MLRVEYRESCDITVENRDINANEFEFYNFYHNVVDEISSMPKKGKYR